VDHWRLRFRATDGVEMTLSDIVELLDALQRAGLEFIKTEQLYTFDGEPGFTLAQGE